MKLFQELRSWLRGDAKAPETDTDQIETDADEIWDCDPLVVVDDDDQVEFAGRTHILLKRLPEDRFALESEQGKDGWTPILVDAERFIPPGSIQVETMFGYDLLNRGKRRGAAFAGTDPTGNVFTWYINSAADDYVLAHPRKIQIGGGEP